LGKKFYEMTREERLAHVKERAGLSDEEAAAFGQPLAFDSANRMVENAVGIMSLPLGIATGFVVNGVERLVPMAIEEPSVIAAASKAAKIAGARGGFAARAGKSLMIGQVQVVKLSKIEAAKRKVLAKRKELLSIANSKSKSVSAVGLQARVVKDASRSRMGSMLIVELIIDTKDAMGANAVNTMCEAIAPRVAEITGGTIVLKILSNYATMRMTKCSAVFGREELGGKEIVERILYAYALAHSDPYRAVTHNKGVMNGIDAVAIATGQDWRAIEAGAHAFACRDGQYQPLSNWFLEEGHLVGRIELPLALGTVGGPIKVHPGVQVALKLMRVSSVRELSMVIAAVGLAQNFAALRALGSVGIQKGHMALHARCVAVTAGARGDWVEKIANELVKAGHVKVEKARELIAALPPAEAAAATGTTG
jgi:hydroxymethylglutaryl-CoA reductase